VGLAVVGVLNSLVSVYYYLGVLVQMYMAEGTRAIDRPLSRPCLLATIVITMIATVGIGVLPGWPMWLAQQSFLTLR
jgi:NADH-quinone oxidoreductase subunit N